MITAKINQHNAFPWLMTTGAILIAGFVALSATSWRFGYEFEVIAMPIRQMVGTLIVMGLTYLGAAFVIIKAEPLDAETSPGRDGGRLLVLTLLVGAVARLALVPSTPILEDDYQRYLWDGAVSANGLNPYAVAPGQAAASSDPALKALAGTAGLVLERVNHPEIRTVYPPGAQAFFALAHLIKPFSLAAWRTVALLMDGLTLVLVLALLRAAGRPLIWSALYWWNPVVIKELANSVHMDAVLMPFVLGAVVLAVRKRPFLATLAVGIGAGIKIWPLALFPLVVRAAAGRISVAIGASLLLAVMLALWAAPMVLAGLDRSAGIVAYAENWRTNSAFFVVLISLADLSGLPSLTGLTPNLVARGFIGLIVVATGLAVALRPVGTAVDALQRAMIVVVIVFLVSPAQFPWYVLWIAPFLALAPVPGLLLLSVTMPLYYVAFYLFPRGQFPIFNEIVIWLVWCPVWALLIVQCMLPRSLSAGRRPRH